jgi:hypothetical protein
MNKNFVGVVALVAGAILALSPMAQAESCIITISGNKYDVATLRGTHPGGDVFVCGTDQTALFNKKHGTDLNRMKPYIVNSSVVPVVMPVKSTSTASMPAVNKQYQVEKKALEKKHQAERKALEKKQAEEKKTLEQKYKTNKKAKPEVKKMEQHREKENERD